MVLIYNIKRMSHECKICNKQYASYQSWWNHNKKFHINEKMDVNTNAIIVNTNVNTNATIVNKNVNTNLLCINTENKCIHCNKIFSSRQAKSLHIKKYCKTIKELEENKKKQEEIRQKELELQLKKEEAAILRLKLKLQNANKVDNITLKKLNKLLLERNNRIKNSTINTNSNNIQNNIVNNYQIVGFGKENIHELLTNQEKRMILNSKFGSLEKLIETVHCGKYNQFKNIIVTNIKDNFLYKYDEKQGMFVLSNKAEVLNLLVDFRMGDLEVIYNDFLLNNKIDNKTKDCIERFINKINYSTNTNDGKTENFKQYKINEIKMLLFNNQEKITNDISLFLSLCPSGLTEEAPIVLENGFV
jgi:C2H2-type zinc finger